MSLELHSGSPRGIFVFGAAGALGSNLARQICKGSQKPHGNRSSLFLIDCNSDALALLANELSLFKTEPPVDLKTANFDVTNHLAVASFFREVCRNFLIESIFYTVSIGKENWELDTAFENKVTRVNTIGLVTVSTCAFKEFRITNKILRSNFIYVSSIASARGVPEFPAYSASKAFAENYMEALELKARKERLCVSFHIFRPGYFQSSLLDGIGERTKLFWVEPAAKVAAKLWQGRGLYKSIFYTSSKWKVLFSIFRFLPRWMLKYL